MKVDLPQASAAAPLDPKEPIVVTVGKDGKLSLGTDEISPERLVEAVEARLGDDRTRVVHLRGDKDAAYGDVVAVMDRLATNGITHIAIVTAPKNRDKAPESQGGDRAVSQAGAIASLPDTAETRAEWALRPVWLRPAAIALALALHAAAAAFIAARVLPASPIDAIDVTLVAQGDAAEEKQARDEAKPAEVPAAPPRPTGRSRPPARRAGPADRGAEAVPLPLARPNPGVATPKPPVVVHEPSLKRTFPRRRPNGASGAANWRRRRSGGTRLRPPS